MNDHVSFFTNYECPDKFQFSKHLYNGIWSNSVVLLPLAGKSHIHVHGCILPVLCNFFKQDLVIKI